VLLGRWQGMSWLDSVAGGRTGQVRATGQVAM
jgi:hypothetical protein